MYKINKNYYPGKTGINVSKLEPKVYTFNKDLSGEPFLTELPAFNIKNLHGESKNIEKLVLDYVESNEDNIGFLFTGTSGMGKTQTIKNIIASLQMPCLFINTKVDVKDIIQICEDVSQPKILFFDEFEKIYDKGEELLSLLDGLGSNRLLTFCSLNEVKNLSQYFFNRPGRFLFRFQFDELKLNLALDYIESKITIQNKTRLEKYLENVENLSYDLCDKIIQLYLRIPESFDYALSHINQEQTIMFHSATLYVKKDGKELSFKANSYSLNEGSEDEDTFKFYFTIFIDNQINERIIVYKDKDKNVFSEPFKLLNDSETRAFLEIKNSDLKDLELSLELKKEKQYVSFHKLVY